MAATMNSKSFDLLWRVLSDEISGHPTSGSRATIEDIYSADIEFSPAIEERLVDYLAFSRPEDFSILVTEVVRKFELVDQDPAAHLLLLGYLVANRQLAVREAIHLAQLPEGECPASNKDVFELSTLAERVEEEDRIGFMQMDEDHFFETNLASFCRARGFDF